MRNKKRTSVSRKGYSNHSAFGYYKRSVVIISMVLVVLVCVLGVHAITLKSKSESYKQQEAELKAQIKEQEARAEEIKEYEEYVKTDEYIKEIAEKKLGLVDPNEIIFKPAS